MAGDDDDDIIIRRNGVKFSGKADELSALAAELPEGHDLKAAIKAKLDEVAKQE